MEYYLGGNPAVSSTSIAPTGSKSGSNFLLTFSRSDLALAGGDATLLLDYGSNLTGWTTVTVPAAASTVGGVGFGVADGSPNDTVTATIPTSGATKFFARLRVTVP